MTYTEAKATKVRGEMYHVTEQFKNIYGKMQFRTILTTLDLKEAKQCLSDYDGTNEVELWNVISAEMIEKKIPILHKENN